jgi:hypothetical protein
METCSNPELSSDPENYAKEDFNALKNTLQHCIPFIRFYNLTSKEFSTNLLPYKNICQRNCIKIRELSRLSQNRFDRPSRVTRLRILRIEYSKNFNRSYNTRIKNRPIY